MKKHYEICENCVFRGEVIEKDFFGNLGPGYDSCAFLKGPWYMGHAL